jgi:hypothetical protein
MEKSMSRLRGISTVSSWTKPGGGGPGVAERGGAGLEGEIGAAVPVATGGSRVPREADDSGAPGGDGIGLAVTTETDDTKLRVGSGAADDTKLKVGSGDADDTKPTDGTGDAND